MKVQSVDLAHAFGFQRIELEPALMPAAVADGIGCHGPAAKRRHGTVPVALARVLLHRTLRVLGVLLALVFIEERLLVVTVTLFRFLGMPRYHVVVGEERS